MTLVGYKGQSCSDSGYFFCPYIPGSTREQGIAAMEEYHRLNPPDTPLQKQIMNKVRNEPQA